MSTLRVNKIQPNSKEAISIDGNVNITGSLVHNGHTTLAGTNVLSGSTTFIGRTNVTGDLTVGGTLTAQEVRTEFDDASVVFESGSTKFGNSSDDIHNFNGSMVIDQGTFKVTNSGDDVIVANPMNGTFTIGDTQSVGDGARISGDNLSVKVIGNNEKTLATYDAHDYYSGIGTDTPAATFHISHPAHARSRDILKVDKNGNQLLLITGDGTFELGDKVGEGDGGYIAHDSETFSIHSIGGNQVADFSVNKINFSKNLHIKADKGQDATITLESDTDNAAAEGDNDNPAILFKQDGSSKNAAIGFNIIDDTEGGTLPGTGNRFWIVNSMEDTLGAGGITFGTAEVDGWENAVPRFMIRGDGKGLFGHPNANYTGSFDSQFEIYDDRSENTHTDYSLATYAHADLANGGGIGTGGVISRVRWLNSNTNDDYGVNAVAIAPGPSNASLFSSNDLDIFVGSNMSTRGPAATGFAGKIFSGSNNWLISDTDAVDTEYRLSVVGNTNISQALTIGENLTVSGDINQGGSTTFSTTACGIVWAMNTDGASIRFHNTSDGDTDSRLEFNTRDNNNEYFRWTHTTAGGLYESMRLSPINSGSNSILKVSGDILADSLTIGDSNTNNNTSGFSSILGGAGNIVDGSWSIIGAGKTNGVVGSQSIIGAGESNSIRANHSSITAGQSNKITSLASLSAINGGSGHTIDAASSFIGGGRANTILINSDDSVIAGGKSNCIAANVGASFIGGGSENKYHGSGSNFSAIVGGQDNCIWGGEVTGLADSKYQFIGGGKDNKTKSKYAVVVGGNSNTAEGESSLIVGGSSNKVVPATATILGGQLNVIDGGVSSNIIGGQENRIENSVLTNVLGGFRNEALGVSNYSSLLGGQENKIEEGIQSVIAGGRNNNIKRTEYGSILGGQDNLLDSSANSSIIGYKNTLSGTQDSHIIGSAISIEAGQQYTTYTNNLVLTGSASVPLSGIVTLERLEKTPGKGQLIGGSVFHSGSAGAGCLYFTPDGITILNIKTS